VVTLRTLAGAKARAQTTHDGRSTPLTRAVGWLRENL
jgi:hypothetical protein